MEDPFIYTELRDAEATLRLRPPMKKRCLPPSASMNPKPLLLQDMLHQYHIDAHMNTKGQLSSIGYYIFEDSYIVGEGVVCSSEGKAYIADDIFGQYWRDQVKKRYSANDVADPFVRFSLSGVKGHSSVRIIEDSVVLLTKPGHQVYGHWIIDILPMIWQLRTQCDDISLLLQSKLLVPDTTPEWAWQMMNALFGITLDDCVLYDVRCDVVYAKRVIVPSMLRQGNIFCDIMNNFSDDVVSTVASPSGEELPKRFFVTRRDTRSHVGRRTKNIDNIERIALDLNLTVVDPSRLPWPDQLRLFNRAELVVGEFGSGLHTTLFSQSTCKVFVLGSAFMNWIQSGISALRQQNMAYMLPEKYEEDGRDKIFIYNEKQFRSGLERI